MKFNQIFAVFKKDFQIESWTKKRFFFEFFAIFLRVSLIFYFSEYLRNSSFVLGDSDVTYFQFIIMGIALIEMQTVLLLSIPRAVNDYRQSGSFDIFLQLEEKTLNIIYSSAAYASVSSLARFFTYFFFSSIFIGEPIIPADTILIVLLSLLLFNAIYISLT